MKTTIKLFLICLLISYATTKSLGQCSGVSITTQPTSQSKYVGDSVILSVAVTGTPPFQYHWYKNVLADTTISSSNFSSSITIHNLTLANNGDQYYCYVTNCSGSFQYSNTAYITVTCLNVSIVTQPVNQKDSVGKSATFKVGTKGSPIISFQW